MIFSKEHYKIPNIPKLFSINPIKYLNVYADSLARYFIKVALFLTNGIQYVNDKCWQITGIHLKICLFGEATKQSLINFEP